MLIAFQGEYGAYSEQAIYKKFKNEPQVMPCESLNLIFEKVSTKEVDCGVIPVENSIGGSIDETYDLLLSNRLIITGEIYLTIKHCLLANPESELKDIKYVYSHPQALKQCTRFLSKLGVTKQATYDTAGSAKMIKKRGRKEEAAIASKVAAKHYGLTVLKEGIESFANNQTRFLVLSKEEINQKKSAKKDYKSSIIFEAADTPGSLYKSLGFFAAKNINLTLLQSRPIKGANWKYLFYLDFEGHVEDPPVREVLQELKNSTISCKILGSYPRDKAQII